MMMPTGKCVAAAALLLALMIPKAFGFSSPSSPYSWTPSCHNQVTAMITTTKTRATTPTTSTSTKHAFSHRSLLLRMAEEAGTNNAESSSADATSTTTTIRTTPDGEQPSNDGDDSSGLFSLESLQDMLRGFDVSSLPNLDTMRTNIMSGEFGTRGEVYAFTQFFLLFCIAIGGVPVVGDTLNVVFGPGLLLAGVTVLVLGATDLGEALSPWPVPVNTTGLKKDGIYAQLRHPMYAGLLAASAGFSIVSGSANRLLLTAILAYALDVKTNYEEQALIDKFGNEYVQYQQDVPGKFVPAVLLTNLPWSQDKKKSSGDDGDEDDEK